jgi:3-deoxy-D-manno-octulosonic-acid transferase
MHNFADETELFLNTQAAWQVQDETQLAERLGILLADDTKCKTLGERAKITMQQHQGVVERYIEYIERYCVLEDQQHA